MHDGHIAGPGLALYYNSLRFFIFAFALAAVFTYVALESSGFADAKLAAEAPCRLDSEEEIAAATQALFQYRWTSFTALACSRYAAFETPTDPSPNRTGLDNSPRCKTAETTCIK